MKRICLFVVALSLMLLVACNSNNEAPDERPSGINNNNNENGTVELSEVYYHPQFFPFIPENMIVSGTFVNESRFYSYGQPPSDNIYQDNVFILYGMDFDGSNQTRIVVPVFSTATFFNMYGLHINDDGNLSFILTEWFIEYHDDSETLDDDADFDVITAFSYRNISMDGEQIYAIDIEELNEFEEDKYHFGINDAIFDTDGNVALFVTWENRRYNEWHDAVIMLNTDFAGDMRIIADLPSFVSNPFISGQNGQIFMHGQKWDDNREIVFLHEVDFVSGTLGEQIQINVAARHITSAYAGSRFDFYLVTSNAVFGLNLENLELTSILNVRELDIPYNPDFQINNLAPFFVFDNEVILFSLPTWSEMHETIVLDFYLLTPSDEPFYDDRIVITLGGLGGQHSQIHSQVAAFNRENPNYRVEFVDYGVDGLTRLQTEVMAGGGPDMFMLFWMGADIVTPLAEGGFLHDLYPLIDDDPVLSRDDFFPSLLSTWENSDGELVQIAQEFSIQTILGRVIDFPDMPESWTYSDFIAFYQEALLEHTTPLGLAFSREDFLGKTVFTDDTFFSFERGEAYFQSESFIALLEAAKAVPPHHNWDAIAELVQRNEWDVVGNLQRGEQVLGAWQNISDFYRLIELQARLGGITALGFPAQNTPIHGVQSQMGTSVGIRANSPHVETTWEFVRMGLLPNALLRDGIFYTRTDLFERELNRQLEREESLPFFVQNTWIDLPPLSETDADVLRDMINNIGHNIAWESPVRNIVLEEASAFFSGIGTAEDAARIIQSRVQIFLSEWER